MPAEDATQPPFFLYFEGRITHGMMSVTIAGAIAQHVCQAARHTRAHIDPDWAEDDHDPGGHVFASVLAHALDNSQGAAIADREALARLSRHMEFSTGCTIERGVTNQYIATLCCFRAGTDGNCASAQALADVVIGFAS